MEKRNKYVGLRYVPKVMGEWDKTKEYEPLMVVTYQGNSYTSKTFIPKDVDITNESFWCLTGNYNAQIEVFKKELTDEINGTNTQVNNKLDNFNNYLKEIVVNVKDFFQVSDNDYTNAFNRAINSLPPEGGTILIPSGYYKVSLDVSGNKKRITFKGNGCILNSTNGKYIIYSDNTTNNYDSSNITFENVTFSGRVQGDTTSNGTCDYGVNLKYTSGMVFKSCSFNYFLKAGFNGLFSQYCDFEYCYFASNINDGAYGVILDSVDGEHRSNECYFNRCRFFTNDKAIGIYGCENTRLINCTIQGNQNEEYAMEIAPNNRGTGSFGSRNTMVLSPWFEINKGYSLKDNSSENTYILEGMLATIGNKTFDIINPFGLTMQNIHAISENDKIDISVSAEGCSLNNFSSNVNLNINDTSSTFKIINFSKNETTIKNIPLKINGFDNHIDILDNRSAGNRSASLNFGDSTGVTGSIKQDMSSGVTTFKTEFGTVGTYKFNINNNDCYELKNDRFKAPILMFADETTALNTLGEGYLYCLNDGTVKVTKK